jgi:NAD+ synthase
MLLHTLARRKIKLDQDFDAISKKIERFISSYLAKSSAKGLVIGLSGGLDSSVVLHLCVNAAGPDRVLGLIMPSSATPQQDIRDAIDLAEALKVRFQVIDLDPIIQKFADVLPEDKRAKGNLLARIRMSILYYYAGHDGYLVTGTSDRTERNIGFFTKAGDGAADILPIADLYKTQVRALAIFLELPPAIIQKQSSPRLWEGHLAEEEIGLRYEIIDPILKLLVEGKKKPKQVARNLRLPLKDVLKDKEMVDKSSHKRNPPPIAYL